jgi:hypothetical protein
VDATSANHQYRMLEIAPRADGSLSAVTGVSVTFDTSATVPLDRPVFSVEGDATFNPSSGTKLLKLKPQSIHDGVMDVGSAGFLVRYVDDNNDGVPDDANGDNRPDLWPRVVVRKLADGNSLLDENDADHNGVLDAQGVDYLHADGTQDGKPDAVVLAAGLVDDALQSALASNGGKPVVVPELTVALRPLALDASNPRAPALLKGVPSGRYSVTLLQFTGQTWRVPNELSPALAAPLGLPAVDSQSFVLVVP